MTLLKFLAAYTGKAVDYDKVYGSQCVDLVRQYFKDVWGCTKQPEGVEGAQEFFTRAAFRPVQASLCRAVPFKGEALPPSGSVVVFKASDSNKYGHIAVCVCADKDGIDVLEQDGVYNAAALKEGRAQKGAYFARWSYSRLLGWLVPNPPAA